jgi:hypothetical protein
MTVTAAGKTISFSGESWPTIFMDRTKNSHADTSIPMVITPQRNATRSPRTITLFLGAQCLGDHGADGYQTHGISVRSAVLEFICRQHGAAAGFIHNFHRHARDLDISGAMAVATIVDGSLPAGQGIMILIGFFGHAA